MISESQPRPRDQRDAFLEELRQARIPLLPDMSARDVVVMMLTIGAHIEHALMVQYLYAAYSLRAEGAHDAERVERWRSALLSVAREEMGHLLTVQNILTLLGAPTDFGRDSSQWARQFFPFTFSLRPFSRCTLLRFIFAEMPPDDVAMPAEQAVMTPSEKQARPKSRQPKKRANHGVDHALKVDIEELRRGEVLRRVGPTYAAIIKLLSNSTLIPDSCFDETSYERQASSDEWSRNYQPRPKLLTPEGDLAAQPPAGKRPRDALRDAYVLVRRAATRSGAIEALRELSEQGEAPHLGPSEPQQMERDERPQAEQDELGEPSHYERFLDIYADLLEHGPPSTGVITNPTTRKDWAKTSRPCGEAAFTLIEGGPAERLAEVFNQRYHLLLNYLGHTFHIARPARVDRPNLRSMLMHRAFAEMYNVKSIAGLLVDLPISETDGETQRAGPPFELPPSLSLPMRETDIWRGHREILATSGRTLRLFLAPTKYDAPAYTTKVDFSAARAYAVTLLQIDAATLKWIDAILAGAPGREANF